MDLDNFIIGKTKERRGLAKNIQVVVKDRRGVNYSRSSRTYTISSSVVQDIIQHEGSST
jgi:uncharacterized membrane protein YjjP (DUF1212 family)